MTHNESYAVAEPDIEIVIRAGRMEVGIFGIFKGEGDQWDIIVGIGDDFQRASVESALEIALNALQGAAFIPVRTLGTEDPFGGQADFDLGQTAQKADGPEE